MEAFLDQAPELMTQLAMGLGLAACAGLRAFLPLLIVGIAGRAEIVPLSGSFEWMASTPALIVFSVAVLAELLGDKFPGVDHFLDILETFAKPVAGTVLMAGVVTDLSPLMSAVVALVLGGTVAGGVHLVKSKLRLISTFTTAGVANPVISVAEDAASLTGSIAALALPFLLLGFLILCAGLLAYWLVRGRRRATPRAA